MTHDKFPPLSSEQQLEMAALVALDAIPDDEHAVGASDVPPSLIPYETTGFLASLASAEPPVSLRSDVLAAALSIRAPGVPHHTAVASSPIDAFVRTIDSLHELLKSLRADDWLTPTIRPYGRVRDLLAHLVGVEENLLGQLGEGERPDPDLWVNHVEATRAAMNSLREVPTPQLVTRWFSSAQRLASVASALPPEQRVEVNDIPTTVAGMLVIRTFETWTHHEDVLRAIARPLPAIEPGRLKLMSSTLMQLLPTAVAGSGKSPKGFTAQMILTGRGGGLYTIGVGQPAVGVPDVVITVDVASLCRRASDRVPVADLDATIEGDRSLGLLVLASASAFARD